MENLVDRCLFAVANARSCAPFVYEEGKQAKISPGGHDLFLHLNLFKSLLLFLQSLERTNTFPYPIDTSKKEKYVTRS